MVNVNGECQRRAANCLRQTSEAASSLAATQKAVPIERVISTICLPEHLRFNRMAFSWPPEKVRNVLAVAFDEP